LVVEDSDVNMRLLQRMLEEMGFSVTGVTNGRDAVTTFVEGRFDVVLMDVQMPIMDGIAATRIIRQHESSLRQHTPIIAVTAGMDRESCMDAGMDDHLLKPIRSDVLKAAVTRAMEREA
jgi:CheY-like chemotaxis protein